MMKRFVLWTSVVFLLFGVLADNSNALDITVDTVWPAGTYVISNNLNIKSGATLTIESGAIVKFTADGLLWVQDGALDASGVTFTWNDVGNEWRGIYFYQSDSRSRLQNCTIEHAKGYSTTVPAMVYLAGGADPGPSITGCTIGNGSASRGIHVGGATSQITSNTISGFSDCGVYLTTRNTTITGNQFQNNAAGVHIYYSSNSSPTVTGNTYTGSTEADLRIAHSTIAITVQTNWNEASGTVYRVTNHFSIGEAGKLSISEGIVVAMTTDTTMWVQTGGTLDATGVTFTWADGINEWRGIYFYQSDSRSRLQNCTIEHAKGYSTTVPAMVYLAGGTDPGPSITGCTIGNGSASRGIHVGGATSQITNNTISGFSEYGLYIGSSFSGFVAGNLIAGNNRGIGIFSPAEGLYRVNRIQGNTDYGIYYQSTSTSKTINAEYNWWGNSSGPTDSAGNPLGTGDRVSSKVDYFPWAGSIADTDTDGMWDEWEVQQFGNVTTASATSDYDQDGLLDKDEFLYGTAPKNRDSDGDGVEDGLEVQAGMSPYLAGDYNIDSDGDTYSNLREIISGTDPYSASSIPPVLSDGAPLPSGDGDVDGKDLAGFMSEFGRTNCAPCKYDLDTDGDVDLADLFLFSEDFGRATP
jgi:parallel beta-helix repeat protein